jgi:predicted dehydrogenase
MQRREFLSKIARAGVAASSTATTFSLAPAAEGKPRIRIGQIGTGHAHADGKLATLRRSPDFELVGVVEPDERLLHAAATRKDYKDVHWLTEEQLLNTPGLRAVAVETEVKDLLAVGGRCVAAGLHLHLDKPAGESLADYRRLLDDATRRGLTVQMGYMFRYNAGFEFCFRAAREGWLGKIFSIEAVIGKASTAAERAKLLPYRGGTMFELGCHLIDAVVTVLGAPQQVTAVARHSGNFADNLLDHQLATLSYTDAIVTVRSSLIEVAGNARRQFVVCGDAGTIDIRPLEPPALRLALAQARGEFKKGYQDVTVPSRPRYEADFVDLARVIRGEREFAWTPVHDLAVQETILRASGLPVG